jgi:queuine/archaeosine tRNA-ribosyltransferase
MLAATLLSIHNLHTLVQLAKDLRAAILRDEYDSFVGSLELKQAVVSSEQDTPIE